MEHLTWDPSARIAQAHWPIILLNALCPGLVSIETHGYLLVGRKRWTELLPLFGPCRMRSHGATTRFWFIRFYQLFDHIDNWISELWIFFLFDEWLQFMRSQEILYRIWGQLTTVRNAFALNLIIATTLKRLSAVAFVIIGIVKVWIFGGQQ